MNGTEQVLLVDPRNSEAAWPIMICMLGNFRLLKFGKPVAVRGGGKIESLLCQLGLRYGHHLPRASLTQLLWPDHDTTLANQSLNSLIYSLHKLIDDVRDSSALVLQEMGLYRLNIEAGVGVDLASFDALARAGDQEVRLNNRTKAAIYYERSVQLYHGDLCISSDVHAIVERERLRARYLTLLMQLANLHYSAADYVMCMEYAWRLLGHDPVREDAHRILMRCYVQRGERAAALHHFQICVNILHTEFGTEPELETTTLFDQIRSNLSSI